MMPVVTDPLASDSPPAPAVLAAFAIDERALNLLGIALFGQQD